MPRLARATTLAVLGALACGQEGALGDSVIFRSPSETRNVVNASYLVYRIPRYGQILVSCAPGSTCRLGTQGALTLVTSGSGPALTITRTEDGNVYQYAKTR